MKLFIISNRLPLKVLKNNGEYEFTRSEGGLATGLDSLQISYEKHWIGWPGIETTDPTEQATISNHLEALNFHPLFLSSDQIKNYYEGYSNSTIWPLCHYFFAYTQYRTCYWENYQQVNRLFCDAACKLIEPGDIVWVQDYQLMLLPGMLRKRLPETSIGYFHHIPFPSYELFRILPERAEVLNGLLGADLIAFHTPDYMRHFISAAERVLHLDFKLDEVRLGNRIVRIDALPMGINYNSYQEASRNPEIQEMAARLKNNFGTNKLILSVDRLDYSKGILHRLKGFRTFLEKHPEYREKVSLAMIIVPSRDQVESYADLKTKIDETIGAINGQLSTIQWTPVHYFYHSFSFEELIAMYQIADIALVTPLRDGMNLVAKEYLAAKQNSPGVLILSEMAGAAVELTQALIVNPNDTDQIEQAICQAIEMPEAEQMARLQQMQHHLSRQTVDKWANDFVTELQLIAHKNELLSLKRITQKDRVTIKSQYEKAEKRLILLDYDGTLAAFKSRPEDASPTQELINLLSVFSIDPRNKLVINSGRDHETLERWFGKIHLSMAAEHGAFYKENNSWHENLHLKEWDSELLGILQRYADKTPHSKIEIKDTALAWHYRNVDAWLGSLREQQLVNALITPCAHLNLQILRGNKVVEIKSPDFTKGSEVSRLLKQDRYDFILAMGDDTTDEDMFEALPANAITIKIGTISEAARYNLLTQPETLPFLKSLV